MIYVIHGQHGTGKTILGQKLLAFLKTSRRNWRRDVFHLDEDIPSSSTKDICEFVSSYGCDIILSTVFPDREYLESWKDTSSKEFIEIYLYADNVKERTDKHIYADYKLPEVNFIQIDTSTNNLDQSFSKLITNLNKLRKI